MNKNTGFLCFFDLHPKYRLSDLLWRTEVLVQGGRVADRMWEDAGGDIFKFAADTLSKQWKKTVICWTISKPLLSCGQKDYTILFKSGFDPENIVKEAVDYAENHNDFILAVGSTEDALSITVIRQKIITECCVLQSDGTVDVTDGFCRTMAMLFCEKEESFVECLQQHGFSEQKDALRQTTGIDFDLRLSQIRANPKKYGAENNTFDLQ